MIHFLVVGIRLLLPCMPLTVVHCLASLFEKLQVHFWSVVGWERAYLSFYKNFVFKTFGKCLKSHEKVVHHNIFNTHLWNLHVSFWWRIDSCNFWLIQYGFFKGKVNIDLTSGSHLPLTKKLERNERHKIED